jgi:hypothetical protein
MGQATTGLVRILLVPVGLSILAWVVIGWNMLAGLMGGVALARLLQGVDSDWEVQ